MAKRGFFITFEGIDGCGKTTQLNLLAEYLKTKNISVDLTKEPGAKGLGREIRQLLLHYDGDVATYCEIFLFLADRAQHTKTLVEPLMKNGVSVLCDRHTDSTIAYQGYGRGENIEQLKYLNNLATNGIRPDLTFVFDIPVEVSQERLYGEKDRMESSGKEFFAKVRNGFLEIAKQEPERVYVIDATKTIEAVAKDVQNIIDNFFEKFSQ